MRGVQERLGTPAAAHLTCACASREEIDAIARRYWAAGIRRIVALRGDAPKDGGPYRPRVDGYAYASDLIAGLRRIADFEINAACYPEVHPEAESALADLENLKRKVEAGATRVVTQYCFDTDRILRFRDAMEIAGIRAEFVPGIMPIHNFTQIRRFSQGCGASIPAWLEQLFAGVDESSPLHAMLAASVAVEQCRRLAAEGLTQLPRLCAQPRRAAAGPSPPARHRGTHSCRRLKREYLLTDFLDHARERVLLLDGAMGTQIQGRDLTLDDFWGQENCSEVLNLSRPDLIREIHLGYLRAGADAVETNSFGGSPITLGEFGLQERAVEINRRAAQLAREAVETLAGDGRARFVIGAIGPGTRLPSLGHVAYRELERRLRCPDPGADRGRRRMRS